VRPRGQRIHLEFDSAVDQLLVAPIVSISVMGSAAAVALRSPRTVARMVMLLHRSGSARNLLKNLLVLPKALWVGRQASRLGIDHVHAYWATTPGTVAMIAAATAGIPFSISAHAADIDENNLLADKSRRGSMVRVISRDGERKVVEAGVKASVVRLIRLGVDLPDVAAMRPRIPGRLSVLVPAALHPMKGHTYLLDAVRLLSASSLGLDVRLLLAGSGPLEATLRRRSQELGLAHVVTFLGQLSHDELIDHYRTGSVDVVALASVSEGGRMAEGIPVSLIEAMSFGIPVVAADSGGVSELVDDTTGILVPMRDPPALADALHRLALDPELADRLGASGRERIRADYDIRRNVLELAAGMSTPNMG